MKETTKDNRMPRPPVVTVMGHVDHGKSTLLDYIRKTNITEKEAGGITQRISAYKVAHKGENGEARSITFLDTPGHEAFQKMRFHSAAAADIAILVVSAEDGAKEQTSEAYNAAKEKNIPLIVAITKIDKPNANVERAKNSLIEREIYIEGYGGDIPCVSLSSKNGEGVSALLDMVLLVADMTDIRAVSDTNAEGVVIESILDPKKGVMATLLIKNGTLKRGMFVVAANSFAPVRILEDFLGGNIDTAGPSDPVRVTGWKFPPPVGSAFAAYKTKKEAEKVASLFEEVFRDSKSEHIQAESPEDFRHTVPLLIKAETLGAVDAIVHEIRKIRIDRIAMKVVGSGVGTITETDAKNAAGSPNTILLGFGVKVDAGAKELASRFGIKIATFDIIYKLTEWLAEEAEARRPRIEMEERKGVLKVLKTFGSTKGTHIVGGRVLEGTIALGDKVKILRRDFEIGRGEIEELQEQKIKAKEIQEGRECGMKVSSKYEIAQGDVLEAFTIVKK